MSSNISGNAASQLGIVLSKNAGEPATAVQRAPLDLRTKVKKLISFKEELEITYREYPKKEIYDSLTLIDEVIRSLKN